MRTDKDTDRDLYLQAEQALLTAEGVAADSRLVHMERLGGQVRILEAGEGPPILFIPGVMTGGAVFAGLVGRLPGYRSIMIDRPGTCLSPQIEQPSADQDRLERNADVFLVDVLDGLGIDRSHVVSTSMGSWTTFRSLATNPERFRRMVGLAYQMGSRMEKLPNSMRVPPIPALLPNRIRFASPRIVRRMLKSAGMRSAIETGRFSDELTNWMVAILRHTDTFGNDSKYAPRPANIFGPTEAILHHADLLAKIDLPVHLFWGTDDVFGGESSAREFAAKLPRATVQMVEGAGHAPWLDEPELAANAVLNHFAG